MRRLQQVGKYLSSRFLLAICLIFIPSVVAHAITINMAYFNEGDPVPHDENPSWDPDGTVLKSHFQTAKAIWENLLPGSGSYDLEFEWDDDIDPLGLTSPNLLSPGDWIIEMNSTKHWFADPTPGTNEEFSTTPTQVLYGQLSASEKSTYFPVASPPLALETGFALKGIVGTVGLGGYDSHDGYDLLSVILHEIGHVLAINRAVPGDWDIDPQHIGGLADVSVLGTFEVPGGSHLAGDTNLPGFLMNPATPPNRRLLPSATDVLAIAADQEINNVHLARVGRIGSGNWNNTNAWIGADVPDVTQDVYFRDAGAVTLDVNASVKSLVVDIGSSINAASFQLAAVDDIQFQGGGTISVGAGGVVSASNIRYDGGALSAGAGGKFSADTFHGDPATLTTATGSTIEFNDFTRGSSTATSATFNGNVKIGISSVPREVTFNPDALATWNVGQNLTVGVFPTSTKLVIDNGVWTVGGNLDIARGEVIVDGGFLDTMLNLTGGDLNVTGSVNIVGALTYRGRVASNTTYSLAGGSANKVATPPPVHLEYFSGAAMTFENTTQGIPIGARVDSATINVGGGTGDGAPGAVVTFKGFSRADDGEFWNLSGIGGDSLYLNHPIVIAGTGGRVIFEDNSTAGTSHFRNDGVNAHGPLESGGATQFRGNSSATSATFDNYGSTLQGYIGRGSPGGRTEFFDTASASSGTFNNHPGQGMGSLGAGVTIFRNNSTAGAGTFYNKGGVPGAQWGGSVEFYDTAKAGHATFYNLHDPSNSQGAVFSGNVRFYGSSSAENATFHNQRGGGTVYFYDDSTAGDAQFFIEDGGTGTFNGHVIFSGNSKGGTADFTINPNCVSSTIEFYGTSNAEHAEITLMNGWQGFMRVTNSASLGHATVDVGSGSGGNLIFRESATAADSTIHLRPGGGADFSGANTTAANATFTLDGATVQNGGVGSLYFTGANVGNATIYVNGGTATNAAGAQVNFTNGTNLGTVTVIGGSGAVAGAGGGRVYTDASSNAANARITIGIGGSLEVGGLGEATIGSLDVAGSMFIGQTGVRIGALNASNTISGPIGGYFNNGNAKVTKVGSGTLTLTGANTYYGLTKVDGGTLMQNGTAPGAAEVNSGATLKGTGSFGGTVTVNSGGTLAPGASPGKITVGGLTLSSSSTVAMELGGTTAGTRYDQVVSTGAFSLAGALNVSLTNGFTPSAGQSFNLFDWGSVSGTFSTLALPMLGSTLGWNTSQLYTTGVLSVAPASIPGDFHQDNVVDARDYIVWRKTDGTQAGYNLWRAHFGEIAGSGAGAESSHALVPEPSTLAILLLVGIAGILRSPMSRRHLNDHDIRPMANSDTARATRAS